mmetsp:Transcript_7512/g.14256  ORF Transcript_7512/g.14256 Transcript_7512/m.14256 type:complete len:187 (+) Transcript_7512:99-659(+)
MGAAVEDDVEEEVEEVQTKGTGKDQSRAYNHLTSYVADREMDTNKVQDAMRKLAESSRQEAERQAERDRELAKVVIKPEDVQVIANQFELEKKKAERILREHDGDVVKALCFLVNDWPQDVPKGVAKDADNYIEPVWKPRSKKKPLPPSATPEPSQPKPASSATSSSASTPATRPASAKPKGKKKK